MDTFVLPVLLTVSSYKLLIMHHCWDLINDFNRNLNNDFRNFYIKLLVAGGVFAQTIVHECLSRQTNLLVNGSSFDNH